LLSPVEAIKPKGRVSLICGRRMILLTNRSSGVGKRGERGPFASGEGEREKCSRAAAIGREMQDREKGERTRRQPFFANDGRRKKKKRDNRFGVFDIKGA